jgi:hypothetical protein
MVMIVMMRPKLACIDGRTEAHSLPQTVEDMRKTAKFDIRLGRWLDVKEEVENHGEEHCFKTTRDGRRILWWDGFSMHGFGQK